MNTAAIILFDGECNLCTRSVQFILAHESGPTLRFASIQSPAGARLLRAYDFDPHDARTFVLVEGDKAYARSEAAVRVARHLRMPWRLAAMLRILPRPLRDAAYNVIARNRYRWFGRRDACMIPTPERAARFLTE